MILHTSNLNDSVDIKKRATITHSVNIKFMQESKVMCEDNKITHLVMY